MADKTVNQTVTLPRALATKARASVPGSDVKRGESLVADTLNVINTSIEDLRSETDIPKAIRQLTSSEGTFSSAMFSFVEVANSGWSISAYTTGSHIIDVDGTRMAQSIAASIDTLFDYSKGYGDKMTLGMIVETSLLETLASGGNAMELVLGKERLPDRINVIHYDSLSWISKGDGSKYPEQEGGAGDPIPLDIPTFFVAELHKFANKAYTRSMMEPAINGSYNFQAFTEEMRKAVRRSGHNRVIITIDAEKVRAAAPKEIAEDPKKLAKWMEDVRTQVVDVVNSMEPEDALVTYDSAAVNQLKGEGEKSDYVPLLNALSGQLATSLKVSPSIIGLRINGSQSLSNTESLVFLKIAKAIQRPVADNLSRALTLATRLYGLDVYVKFKFNPINLRPEDELEAFKSMKQSRIFQLLSEGFISDEAAALALGTGARPPGAPQLMGTGFMRGSKGIDASKASPNDDPQGAALQPDTPNKAGGESQ